LRKAKFALVSSCTGVNLGKALVFEARAFFFWVDEFLFYLIFARSLDIIFSQSRGIRRGVAGS